MGTAESASADIAMYRSGGSGPDCLLLHGFGSDRLSWIGMTPALAPRVTVHALDLPGHGEAGPDVGTGTPLELAQRVEAAVEKHGLRHVHLVGHSLGGGIGLLLAQRRPDLIASLILIAPAGLGVGIKAEFLAAFPRLVDTATATALLHELVVRPHLIGKQTVARALDQLARPGIREALTRVGAGLISQRAVFEDAAAAVASSPIPRMIIWGQADRINPPSAAHLARFGGELHLIAGAGHLPHIESAKPVSDLLTAFFAKHAAG